MTASEPETAIHPSAVVMPGSEIGPGVEIGPFCVVEPGAEIGAGCRLSAHVHLMGRVKIGPGTRVGDGTVIGGEPQDAKYDGSRGLVRIGAGCKIFEHCTIHRPSTGEGETVIGESVMMMAGSHVGHNARLGDSVVMVNLASVGGHGEIGDRSVLTLGSSLHQYGKIGRLTLVGGYSPLTLDAPPFSIVTGSYPPVWRGPNPVGMRRAGLSAATRDAIRRAMNRIFRSGESPLEAARALLGDPVAEVAELAHFLIESKRGFCRAPRGGGREEPELAEDKNHD